MNSFGFQRFQRFQRFQHFASNVFEPRNCGIVRRLAAKLSVAFAFIFACATSMAQVPIIYAYEFSGSRLISFAANAPGTLLSDVAISGLGAGEFLVGIDFRPATGDLYGLVFQNATTGRLVTIDRASGAMTSVGASTVAISGAYYGLSFTPTVDRIRVVSNFDTNIRINPSTSSLVGTDTTLSYLAGDTNFGINPSVTHLAHTNAFAGATTTTTYAIDTASATLVRIGGPDGTPSPNGGSLTTIGSLGVSTTFTGGFDIEPTTNQGYAVLTVGGLSVLHRINLATARRRRSARSGQAPEPLTASRSPHRTRALTLTATAWCRQRPTA